MILNSVDTLFRKLVNTFVRMRGTENNFITLTRGVNLQ